MFRRAHGAEYGTFVSLGGALNITSTQDEWEKMWDALASLTGSYSDENPENGERWQYMGSVGVDGGEGSLVIVHQFRHRWRVGGEPIKGSCVHEGRIYLEIGASQAYHDQHGLVVPEVYCGRLWDVKGGGR